MRKTITGVWGSKKGEYGLDDGYGCDETTVTFRLEGRCTWDRHDYTNRIRDRQRDDKADGKPYKSGWAIQFEFVDEYIEELKKQGWEQYPPASVLLTIAAFKGVEK